MPTPDSPLSHRDGTSQASRILPALQPEYVSVDERSVGDLIAFASEYAKELKYYGLDNQEAGDWSGFLSRELDLDDVVAFMDEQGHLKPEQIAAFSRPHVVLFLAFLKLLRHAQSQLNTLTRRHLEFYYRQVLRMTKKGAVPDRVDVLLELAAGVDQALLPAGSVLNAGPDSEGQDRLYSTERDIVVNRAQITRVSSVFADQCVTGIREAREEHEGTKQEARLRMFEIALGDPLPGDPLPHYGDRPAVDYAFLIELQGLVDFTHTALFMEFFELRSVMRLKGQRDHSDDEWAAINRLLEKAGRTRTPDRSFRLATADPQPFDPRDFDANLAKAIGRPDYRGITQVENVYDLYDQQHFREEVQEFVRTDLFFDDIEDFRALMALKRRIDRQWGEINRLLEQAARRKPDNGDYQLVPEDAAGFDASDFTGNLQAALGPLDYSGLTEVGDIDQYYAALLDVEEYFFMPAEEFTYVLTVAEKTRPPATATEWNKVYEILADAHKEKIYSARRRRLREIREAQESPQHGFDTMVHFALGEDNASADPAPLARLQAFVGSAKDSAFLTEIQDGMEQGTPEGSEWDRVYRVVEVAQRNRENLPEPVARHEEWLNLYPTEDATTANATLGVAADADNPRWHTFGERPVAKPDDSPIPALGWAISTPVLSLSEGRRSITLTLGFETNGFDATKIDSLFQASTKPSTPGPFRIEVSTAKGWIEADTTTIRRTDYGSSSGVSTKIDDPLPALQFTLTFGEDIDPIAPLDDEEAPIVGRWPVLRLMLNQIWRADIQQFVTPYYPFRPLRLVAAHVRADVSGLTTLQLHNDETVLDAKKPFEPFGSSPSVGSRFFVGHPELVEKRLDSLRFDMEWMGAPANLESHYTNYPGNLTNSSFKSRVSLVDRRVQLTLEESAALFAVDAGAPTTIDIGDVPSAIQRSRNGYPYRRELEADVDGPVIAWSRHLLWELIPTDFQHGVYPGVASKQSMKVAAAIAAAPKGKEADVGEHHVNPPYTPKLKSLSVTYTSSAEVMIAHYERPSKDDRIYHIHPFGHNEIALEPPEPHCPFLPQYDHEGELYIGIQGVRPPQNLAILFQMAEGSANPDLSPVPIQWSYLSDDRWHSLDGERTLLDTTRGLINSGIIEFDLAPVRPYTRLPADLFWIRAAVPFHTSSLCDTVALHTQAVSATLVDNNNAPDHFSQPLPAESIKGLAERQPEIARALQPYTSYGGKPEERDSIFYTRVSERLRHKQRALTIWDYERLVLERFPQIYKVKCLAGGEFGQPDDSGLVRLIVIPNVQNRLPFNPFEPKAPTDLIAEIETYLVDRIPAYATVSIRNAHFIRVKVKARVRFRPGCNEGFYKQQLDAELSRFLSPWAYEEGADIIIEGKIYSNSIVDFIDRRDYVDYVADIKLYSSDDGARFRVVKDTSSEGYYVTAGRPDGVLVAARQHEIDVISEMAYEEESFTGIAYMRVELDFEIK